MLYKTYNNGQLSVKNHYLSIPFRHVGVNCSDAQTEVVTGDPGDPLLQIDNTLKETEPHCRLDMHSDTTIEEHIILKCFVTSFWSIMAAIFEFVDNF